MNKLVIAAIGIFGLVGVAAAGMGHQARGHDGMHRAGMHQGMIFSDKLHQQLNLTGAQEAQWQALKARHDAMGKQMHDVRKQSHDAIKAELDKPAPDLNAVNNLMEVAHDQNIAARKAFHKDALAFYNSLSPDRQAIVVGEIKGKMAKMQGMRERIHGMHDKMQKPQ